MNRLLLLRHAKSSWDDPSLADHERPLAPRGHRAAESMAEHLRSSVPHPDLVLCSSALRTRETLDRMSKAFGDAEVPAPPRGNPVARVLEQRANEAIVTGLAMRDRVRSLLTARPR